MWPTIQSSLQQLRTICQSQKATFQNLEVKFFFLLLAKTATIIDLCLFRIPSLLEWDVQSICDIYMIWSKKFVEIERNLYMFEMFFSIGIRRWWTWNIHESNSTRHLSACSSGQRNLWRSKRSTLNHPRRIIYMMLFRHRHYWKVVPIMLSHFLNDKQPHF